MSTLPTYLFHPSQTAPSDQIGIRADMSVWFTGLSGAGKSTLANAVAKRLEEDGYQTVILDGDVLRQGLCRDLGFGPADRRENMRRAAEVARLCASKGVISLVAMIAPMQEDRDYVRSLFAPGAYREVFCNAPLTICEQRDVKGLYRRARALDIPEFTGISAPYEIPHSPDLVLDTYQVSIETSAARVMACLKQSTL